MGVSTDGQICYGIVFEEGFGFPWDVDEKWEGDIDSWWLDVSKYKNPLFCPYTEEGELKEGINDTDPRISEFHQHRYDWTESHPLPITLVNYCSGDCDMYIMAIPATCFSNSRGYPEEFTPEIIVDSFGKEDEENLYNFCTKYNIEIDGGAKWWLSSYWG